MKRLKIKHPNLSLKRCSVKELETGRTTSLAALKQAQAKHKQLRADHLQKCVEKAALIYSKDVAAVVRNVQTRETAMREFGTLRIEFKPERSVGLDRIEVLLPPEAGDSSTDSKTPLPPKIKHCFTTKEIHEEIIKSNYERFRQAKETPFAQGERMMQLGHTCETEDTYDLLNGSYAFELGALVGADGGTHAIAQDDVVHETPGEDG